jgi:hypothetical protein
MNMKALLLALVIACSISDVAHADPALLLFGGQDHKTFLGCLNCGQYDRSSVWNGYGQYGSPYQSDSIWNAYGHFGSEYNSDSPWNSYSSTAPAIVDEQGNFYGYFSTNKYNSKRTTINWIVWLLDNYDWVKDHLDEVREKIG